MTIRRLNVGDFEQMYNMVASHDTHQGLPRSASFLGTEADLNDMWRTYHSEAITLDNFYYFGEVDNKGIIHAFIQYEMWVENGVNVVSSGSHISNKTVDLSRSYGQSVWYDCFIDISNYAVTFFDNLGITTFYAIYRGALADKFVGLADVPQTLLYQNYNIELAEYVNAGKFSTNREFFVYVLKSRRTTAQRIMRLVKKS